MKRMTLAVAASLFALSATAQLAEAQGKYAWIGAGAGIPIGDSGDGLKTGYLADVGIGFDLREKVDLHLGVLFGNNPHKIGDRSTDLLGGSVGLEYAITTGKAANPYVLGGVGAMRLDAAGEADTEFMFHGGGGIAGPLSPRLGYWIEARYLQAGSGDSKLTIVPLAAGIVFGF